MSDLPTGTVTFLFTDIEGSTTRWEHHPDAMRTALARHDTLLRSVITSQGGYVFKMVGDAVYAAFAVAADAVTAAIAAQRAVSAEEWGEVGPLRVRMALHTGAAQSRDDDYFGPTLNRVARILSTGYGGQVLVSAVTFELVRDALPAGGSVQDLGEHALKDLLRPEHVFQLTISDLPGEFPALKSLSRLPHNLPVQPTPFLGREQEVATVCALVHRPEVRLVTLTGPGGIGKTRLGLQVAAELSDQFADGVFIVYLAPISDVEQVVTTMIQTLGISEAGNQPLLVLLTSALKDKQRLLLLDNFEQVVQAAVVVAELLVVCPTLKVLVTSRVVLHVRAEHEYTVPPLSLPNLKRLPDLAALSHYEAVALFIERAQAVKPDFQVTNANAPAVAAICARLDGLPLAIELAAARVKYFPPQMLLKRLEQGLAILSGGARDLPARQQTLRGTMAWSYDLLPPEEQMLFRRCAVFVDGCTLEAAEVVCTAAGGLQGDVLEGLVSLVDKSLLRQEEQAEGEARFWMLHVLREFGLEALATRGEMEAARQAHATYYLALVEEVESEPEGSQHQAVWLERLEQEHDNLRAAMQWSLEQAEARQSYEMALRVGGALRQFWLVRGYWSEGQNFLKRALAGSEGATTSMRVKALSAAAHLALRQGNYNQGGALAGESLVLCRELGDAAGIAFSLYLLGNVAWLKGNYAAARSLTGEALALFMEVGDQENAAWSLFNLARIAVEQGDYSSGRASFEETLRMHRELGNKRGIAASLVGLAWVIYYSQGDPATERSLLEEGLALFRELGDKENIADSLNILGWVILQQGEAALARSLAEESLVFFREERQRTGTAESLLLLARVAAVQGNHVAARTLYEESLALFRGEGDKWDIASGLEGLASVVAAQGELEWAARLWGAAEALREAYGIPLPPVYRADHERAVAAARAQLGKKTFATAWAEGRTTPVEQAITTVLKMDGGTGKQ